MSDQHSAAHDKEEPSRQVLAKRVRHTGTADPYHQTQGSAVSAAHAVHAEPGGSTTQSPQPAAAAAGCALAAHQLCIALYSVDHINSAYSTFPYSHCYVLSYNSTQTQTGFT